MLNNSFTIIKISLDKQNKIMVFIKIVVYLMMFLSPVLTGKIIKRQSSCNFEVTCTFSSFRCRNDGDCKNLNQMCCSRTLNSGVPIVAQCCASPPATLGPTTPSTTPVSLTTLINPSSLSTSTNPSVSTNPSAPTNPSVPTNPSTSTNPSTGTATNPTSTASTARTTAATTTIRPGK